LDPRSLFEGGRFILIGGTGFLGKVFLSMMLDRFGDQIDCFYLICRARKNQTSQERYWAEIVPNGVFEPLRAKLGEVGYHQFMRRKVIPIDGDVTRDFGGVSAELRDEIRGSITAIINVAGVVDFNPPLDYALNSNAYGAKKLVQLCKDLGSPPFMHTSTCYVAGDRTGQVEEIYPLDWPFPKADSLDVSHWDPEREIAEGADQVENTRIRLQDAFRQSHFHDQALKNLKAKGEPTRGRAFDDELAKVKRAFENEHLVAAGLERAKFWGWHNVYTYTKSIGEQIYCRSGIPLTIVRPAVIESALAFPSIGWTEGINTSSPLIYLALKGMHRFPASKESILDIIPVDLVSSGMVLALAELLDGTAKPVYQLGSSERNPLFMYRFIELFSLFKRRYYREEAGGSALTNWLQSQYGSIPVSAETYFKTGPSAIAERTEQASGFLRRLGDQVLALKPLLDPTAKSLSKFSRQSRITAKIVDQFVPFTATHTYRFVAKNTREAWERVDPEQQALLRWDPDQIDWHHYMLEIHMPGVVRHVMPQIEEKINKPAKPLRSNDDLIAFLDEVAERFEYAPALLMPHPEGFERLSYAGFRARAQATGARLVRLGIRAGDRVMLAGQNDPMWPVAWFGVLLAGAVVVPVDPALTPDAAQNIASTCGAAMALLDKQAADTFGKGLGCPIQDLFQATAEGPTDELPDLQVKPDDIASILFTSGTTGVPKGVMLSHGNFTALLASLKRIFDLDERDRMLSVLPLHHTFEFTCGLLLPLSYGCRITYLTELTGDALSKTLRDGRITAMVGVPALWQLLERRIKGQVEAQSAPVRLVFDIGMELNRMVGRATGLDIGKLMFGEVHERLGGNIRLLISGGAALPKDTHHFFSGLGLHLTEGYGLTEASPVLAVSKSGPGSSSGNVGKAIPGVQIKIGNPDDAGVGEVLAKGPNVMRGYYGNEEATRQVLTEDGWLRTGDLGRLDHRDRLILVGRAKDVVVTASGENLYLDDLENQLGQVRYVQEYCLVGIADPRGGERLGLLAVPQDPEDAGVDRNSVHARAKTTLKEAIAKRLPKGSRPAVMHLVDADLPRTATRKVQRNKVREVLERIVQATERPKGDARASGPVRNAVAQVAGVKVSEISGETVLGQDLSFDSLMLVELASALDAQGSRPGTEALAECETVADIERLVAAPAPTILQEPDVRDSVRLPGPLVGTLRSGLGSIQRGIYGNFLRTRVTGRAFIPKNRSVIVVSNHCSHLDMGLVKFALGPYGHKLAALAAKDYFFEGNRWWVAYFEQLTNLQPIDRSGSFRKSFKQAKAVIEAGEIVLLFPEGTRRTDGVLGPFKPMVGKLSLETGVDVLPIYLDGTFDVLPKGAVLPRGRKVTVRIGPVLEAEKMRALAANSTPGDAARMATTYIREAIRCLRDGDVLNLDRVDLGAGPVEELSPEEALADLMGELPGRFIPGSTDEPKSWYWKLGDADDLRWTVLVQPSHVKVRKGRPPSGKADCVVVTNLEILTRIVLEGYQPEPTEFFSGAIKTNDIPMLMEFGECFRLGEAGAEANPA
jgi:long-chain acyl-CoA synthetase